MGWHRRAAVDVLDSNRHGGFPVIGWTACHHLIHHDTQGIQVTAVVRVAALGLLWGNVVHTSQCLLGQRIAFVHDPGDAEVHDLHGAVFQHHDVVGLDIPMDDAPAVGVFQSLGDLHGEMQRLLPVQHALLFHILLQGNAVDKLHNDEVGTFRGGNVINLDDVGMAQHGHGFALGMEPAAELLVPGKFVFQYFDRDQPVQPMAASFIYNGHAASAEDLQNLVPVIQQPSNILIHIQEISSFRSYGLNQDQHAGHIVRRTAHFRDVQQPLTAVLLVDAVDDFKQDLLVVHQVAQPVAAQQEIISPV